jgi:hypothetical protein
LGNKHLKAQMSINMHKSRLEGGTLTEREVSVQLTSLH